MRDEMERDQPEQQDSTKKKRTATEAQRAAGIANLRAFNASRNNKPHTIHGVATLIRTGSAPSDIERRLDEFEEGVIRDLGGAPSMSEIALIQSARTALGVCFMVDAYIQKGGLSNFGRNKWLLKTAAAYANTLRLNLQALTGKKWLGEPVEIVADIAEKRRANSLEAMLAADQAREDADAANFFARQRPLTALEAEEVAGEEVSGAPAEGRAKGESPILEA